jgi:phosphate transport system substrate-binding protein
LAAAQAFTHIPRNSRIVMTPRTPEDAYVYWEVPEEHKAEVRRQGGRKLMLRVYDATNIDLDQQTAHSFRQYECSELDTDKHVPIPVSDRDYVAELGYITDEGSWLSLTRSEPVRVPSPKNVVGDDPNVDAAARVAATEFTEGSSWKPLEGLARTVSGRLEGVAEKSSDLLGDTTRTASDLADQVTDKASGLLGQTPDKVSDLADEASKAMGTAIAGGAAAVAGIGAVAQSFLDRGRTVLGGERTESGEYVMPRDCRIILVPRNSRDAYAYWEVSEQYKQAARQQGGRRLMLRVHDATNLDIDQQPPHSTQEYALTDLDTDKHVPIPVSDRDYIAELGYYTDDNQWIRIIRSFHVRVPAND